MPKSRRQDIEIHPLKMPPPLPLFQGTTIGADKELKFTPTTAQHFRLHILGAKLNNAQSKVAIDEFQLFVK